MDNEMETVVTFWFLGPRGSKTSGFPFPSPYSRDHEAPAGVVAFGKNNRNFQ